jgi:hypothetical protein
MDLSPFLRPPFLRPPERPLASIDPNRNEEISFRPMLSEDAVQGGVTVIRECRQEPTLRDYASAWSCVPRGKHFRQCHLPDFPFRGFTGVVMANYYIEIPGTRLRGLVFPDFCPFTLDEDTSRKWEVTKRVNAGTVFWVPFMFCVINEATIILTIPVSRRYAFHQACVTMFILASIALLAFLFSWVQRFRNLENCQSPSPSH